MDDTITEEEIAKMTNEDLSAFVVMHRCLGQFEEEEKLSMMELMKRQVAGSQFDFQAFIEDNSNKCQINLKIPSFVKTKQDISRAIINTVIDVVKKTQLGQEEAPANNVEDDDWDDDEDED